MDFGHDETALIELWQVVEDLTFCAVMLRRETDGASLFALSLKQIMRGKKKKAKVNPHCPVPGCRATAPHINDPVVNALMKAFAPPAEMTKWTWVSMCELTASICRDLEAKKLFAFHSRIRQPEELYIRTLYALFIATDKGIPHILSGAVPNGLAGMYTEVNRVVFEGRGLLLTEQPRQVGYSPFKPIDTLHDGAHGSFRSFLTCIGWALNPEQIPSLERYGKHLQTYCDRLNYMHEMFKAGKRKEHVLAGIRNMHRPASYWRAKDAQKPST